MNILATGKGRGTGTSGNDTAAMTNPMRLEQIQKIIIIATDGTEYALLA